MIQVLYGDDRLRANQEIKKTLGPEYEVIDGPELNPDDLPSIFLGTSLFSVNRAILIRDFTANRIAYEQLEKYLNTPHNIILLETKLDKRTAAYKALKDKIKFKEFKLPENQDFRIALNIFSTAKTNGRKAVEMLEQIKQNEDPIMFFGLLVSQAVKDFSSHQNPKNVRVLKELSRVDLSIKMAKVDPWLLIESFLVRLKATLLCN